MYPDNREKNLEIFHDQKSHLFLDIVKVKKFFSLFSRVARRKVFSQPLAENPTFRTPAILWKIVLLLGFCVMRF